MRAGRVSLAACVLLVPGILSVFGSISVLVLVSLSVSVSVSTSTSSPLMLAPVPYTCIPQARAISRGFSR
jgi:hypothetical protein